MIAADSNHIIAQLIRFVTTNNAMRYFITERVIYLIVAKQHVEENGQEKGIMYVNADTGELIEYLPFDEFPLAGKTIVLNGTDADFKWKTKELIEGKGAKVAGSVSRKTSFLVCLDDTISSKVTRAMQLNIPIIQYSDLLNMIGDK